MQICSGRQKANNPIVNPKNTSMFRIKVADKHEFTINKDNGNLQLNGQPVDWDVEVTGQHTFSIMWNQEHYDAEVQSFDKKAKKVRVKVNNNIYEMDVKDEFDLLLEKMGMHQGAGAKLNELKSPMPGLVLDVMVTSGQEVKKGDPLLILEAMKMENVLKSPGEGVVKEVAVTSGDAVEKNALLIEFD